MKYAVEVGSGAIPSLLKTGSGFQTLIRGGGNLQTHGQHDGLISLLYFFKGRKLGSNLHGDIFYLIGMKVRDSMENDISWEAESYSISHVVLRLL
jgi:hypothetical protein